MLHNHKIRKIMKSKKKPIKRSKKKPKILSYFCEMKDSRIERKKLHPLVNIIFITISAVLCGAKTWEDIEDFGYSKSA